MYSFMYIKVKQYISTEARRVLTRTRVIRDTYVKFIYYGYGVQEFSQDQRTKGDCYNVDCV